jgi:type VI secretion system protein VasD
MMSKSVFIRGFLVTLLAALVCACATPQVKMNLTSTANLNMNSARQPLPVVVRIYQLTDAKAFENATFDELWKNDLAALGNTLLRKDTLTLDPASRRQIHFDRDAQTRFVAVMAAFNHQNDNSWRVVKKIKGSFFGIKYSSRIDAILKDKVIEIVE